VANILLVMVVNISVIQLVSDMAGDNPVVLGGEQ
jgi:hypothetical protein